MNTCLGHCVVDYDDKLTIKIIVKITKHCSQIREIGASSILLFSILQLRRMVLNES